MNSYRWKQLLSYLLVAGGVILLFLGARDLLDWHLGQSSAEREFESAAPAPAPPPSAEPNPSPSPTPTPPRVQAPQHGDTMAKLTIPRLDAQLYVVEGDSPSDLRRGPGHMPGTALPGADGNCVIAGHRDTHFRVLKDIQRGDDIVVRTKTGQYLYRVLSIKVVSPDYTEPLQPTKEAELNLITCYPFFYVGSAPKRFVVEARLAGAVGGTS